MGTGWRNARPHPVKCHLCTLAPPVAKGLHRFNMFGLKVNFKCPTPKDDYERDRETIARVVEEALDEERRGT